MTVTVEQLKEAGFNHAANELELSQARFKRLNIAYNNFEWIRTEHIKAYNKKLYDETIKRTGKKGRDLVEKYDRLKFTALEKYAKVPPAEVLDKVIAARKLGCFDQLQVCTIESVVEHKDPIVFGVISGCTDRFFVAQWDDDIKFEDLIAMKVD